MDDVDALPSAPLTVAAGQAACAALDIAANAATAADLVRRAADQGADLLVLPELFLTGYELPGIVADPISHQPIRAPRQQHHHQIAPGHPQATLPTATRTGPNRYQRAVSDVLPVSRSQLGLSVWWWPRRVVTAVAG